MTLAPMDNQGPYIPFEKPVPVPGVPIDELPVSCIAFNQAWSPAILGALKVLARPETWGGTQADINAATQDAHNLLAAIDDGCVNALNCAEFYPDYDTDHCPGDPAYTRLIRISECDPICPPAHERNYVILGDLDPLGTAWLGLTFRRADDDTVCGGRICQIYVEHFGGVLITSFAITIGYCDGRVEVPIVNSQAWTLTGQDILYICIYSLAPFVGYLSISGPVICGSA